jgi:N4-bis(aminopropyl)spermidine synthase
MGMSSGNTQSLLGEVAEAVRLREGAEGIRTVLRVLHAECPITTRALARRVLLPVPVIAAIRGEFEKRGLAIRGASGILFTEHGSAIADSLFGSSVEQPDSEPAPEVAVGDLVSRMERLCAQRPDADVSLDQAKATPATLAKRVNYLRSNDCITGRRVLLLGDDDFVSAAISDATHGTNRICDPPGRICVVDIDKRILEALGQRDGIESVWHDARDPLPESLRGAFDVICTDTPYTVQGAELFLSRAVEAADQKTGAHCFFSFGHVGSDLLRQVQSSLAEMGWVVTEWLPGFNEYEGAGVLAGVSLMAHLVLARDALPVIDGRYDGPLYTADVRPTIRKYRCTSCGSEYEVGPDMRWQTIVQLKRQTCAECGADRFRRIGQRSAEQASKPAKRS